MTLLVCSLQLKSYTLHHIRWYFWQMILYSNNVHVRTKFYSTIRCRIIHFWYSNLNLNETLFIKFEVFLLYIQCMYSLFFFFLFERFRLIKICQPSVNRMLQTWNYSSNILEQHNNLRDVQWKFFLNQLLIIHCQPWFHSW